MNHKIAVIIVSFNGEQYLFNCLNSLKKQEAGDFKVILVDNNSQDDSKAIVKKYFPEVKIIENRKNKGFTKANNQGIEQALREGYNYLVLLNQDVIVEPDFLEKGLKIMADKKVGLACPKIKYRHTEKIWWAGSKLYRGKEILLKPTLRLGKHIGKRKSDSKSFRETRETDYITGCALFTRKDVIEKIGKLDETFFMYGEDIDWSLKAQKMGFKLIYFPDTTVFHDVPLTKGFEIKSNSVLKKALNYLWGILVNLFRHYQTNEIIFWFIKLPFLLPFIILGSVVKLLKR